MARTERQQPRTIDVSTPRRCQSLRGVEVHGRRTCERVWHKRLPTTNVEQTLLDYAAVASLERTRHALAVADYKHVLDVAGIPLPEVNVWVEGVLVDAVWRDRKVIVELDGRDNHSSWAQIQRDRSNELRLRAADFEVRRYGWVQLEDEPTLVETDLRRALGVPR